MSLSLVNVTTSASFNLKLFLQRGACLDLDQESEDVETIKLVLDLRASDAGALLHALLLLTDGRERTPTYPLSSKALH